MSAVREPRSREQQTWNIQDSAALATIVAAMVTVGTLLGVVARPSGPEAFRTAYGVKGNVADMFHQARSSPELAERMLGLTREYAYSEGSEQIVIGRSLRSDTGLLEGADSGLAPGSVSTAVLVDQEYLGVLTRGRLAGIRANQRLTVIAVPAKRFTIDVLCLSGVGDGDRSASVCEEVAATLTFPPSDEPAMTDSSVEANRTALLSEMNEYAAGRKKLLGELALGRDASAQKHFAAALGALCGQAGETVAGLATTPLVKRAEVHLAQALLNCQGAYRQLAAAIAAGELRHAAASERAVIAADDRISTTLARLRDASVRFHRSNPPA